MTAVAVAAGLVAAAVWLRGLPGRYTHGGPVTGGLTGRVATRGPRLSDPARAWRDRQQRRRAADQLGELVSALAAELAAGQPAEAALLMALGPLEPNVCPRTRGAARIGAGIPEALRVDAMAPGMRELRSLAACWEVAAHSGAGLAGAVFRLGDSGRARRRASEQLRAEVAAVQATARMLAVIPLFGVAVGQWMGADPVAWLLGGWAGRITLLIGLVLEAVGLLWLALIVRSARAAL